MTKGMIKCSVIIAILLVGSSFGLVTRSNTSTNGVQNQSSLKPIMSESIGINHHPQPRGHDWYMDGYGHDLAYGKSDYYWLIPLVIVIGFGALLLPLLGTLMTTMITSGTLTLQAGRRKRNINEDNEKLPVKSNGMSETFIKLLTQLEKAMNKFGEEINGRYGY